MYARLGFGLSLTELKKGNVPIGICGLIERDFLVVVIVSILWFAGLKLLHRRKSQMAATWS